MNDYTGSYFSKELNVIYNFEIISEKLNARIENKQSIIDCTINEVDQFTTKLGVIRFQRTDGVISEFELDSGRVKDLKFKKK